MRSRAQILQPIYDLVCEANGHLRDARVAVPTGIIEPNPPELDRLVLALVGAHQNPMCRQFCVAYRNNQAIDLNDLLARVEFDRNVVYRLFAGDADACIEPVEIDPIDPTLGWARNIVEAAKDAHRCYASAIALIKVIAAFPDDQAIIPSAPLGIGRTVHAGP